MSLRAWLATRFSLLLVGAMALFVVGIYFARQAGAHDEAVELAQERARLAQMIVRRISEGGAPITVRERRSDSLPPVEGQRGVQLEPRVIALLHEVGGFLWVLGERGGDSALYASVPAKQLDSAALKAVNDALKQLRLAEAPSRSVTLGRAGLLPRPGVLVERLETLPNGQVLRVVAGVPLSDVSFSPLELLAGALIVLPLVLALAVGAAFLTAARATEPLERLTNEVVEITDGRSLHRRLQLEGGTAELARLTAQLNEMIGRLEMSFIALRRFTADASHELKTPLAVMRVDVERAMHLPQGSTEQLVALEEALHETARMADLVESLLTLARADEGRFDLMREPVELVPLARDVFETALILGEDAGLTVTMPSVENALVSGDRIRLRQLFLNLITNAIKYTPRGGEVELHLVVTETEAQFSVRDTGIGIAAIDVPNIFDRFYRADRVRSRASERGGFGLGLSISQWIAQAHGGTLTVQSRLHRGSTFTVTLPLAGAEGVVPTVERRAPQTATVA